MVLGIMPGMSLTALAGDASPYAGIKNTTTVVKLDDKDWYLIDYDDSTVTLLTKDCIAKTPFNSNETSIYSGSIVNDINNFHLQDS